MKTIFIIIISIIIITCIIVYLVLTYYFKEVEKSKVIKFIITRWLPGLFKMIWEKIKQWLFGPINKRRIKKSTQKKSPIKKTKGKRKSAKVLRKMEKKKRRAKYLIKCKRKNKKRRKKWALPRKIPTTITSWIQEKFIRSSLYLKSKINFSRYQVQKKKYSLWSLINHYPSANQKKISRTNLYSLTPNYPENYTRVNPSSNLSVSKYFCYTRHYKSLRRENIKMVHKREACKRTPAKPHKNMTFHIYKK